MTPEGDSIVVFAGPSLPPAIRPSDPRFVWRPPAVAGDAYRLAALQPKAMVLIDGLFDEQPAIRHKELLELVARGVFVIGGASMGALRAAELAPFGMIGVGRIYEAYANGHLVGDDEVAILHGPEEWAWEALTEPLVNVRATLVRALRDFVIDVKTARLTLGVAMRIFYKERTWPVILAAARERAFPAAPRLEALSAWLPDGRVDLKRRDALDCLERALALGEIKPEARPFPPKTPFDEALAGRGGPIVR